MTEIYPEATIIGEKIYLRAYQSGDEIMISRLENHPDPRETLFYALPTTVEQQLEKTKKQLNDKHTILFTICDKETHEPVGQTAFVRIDWIGRMGIFYLGIADKRNWSKGFGYETTKIMVDYAFNTLNFHRVELKVATENEAAFHVYQKVGFIKEGTLRQAMYHHGKYCDFHVMGILKQEFYSKK